MPVLFLGHGSPMNAIEQNEFANKIKKPAEPSAVNLIWIGVKTTEHEVF
jgi:hypothetical protein